MNLTLEETWSPTLGDIPDHLQAQALVPVVGPTPVPQGDLLIAPRGFAGRKVVARANAKWVDVPVDGVKIIDGRDTGGHDHVLVAKPGTARVTFDVDHPSRLAICLIEVDEAASIQHVEHGAVLLVPEHGPYECRGQREWADEERRVAD